MSPNDNTLRYKLLADAAVAAASGTSSEEILTQALNSAIEAIGLVVGSVRILDETEKVDFYHITGRDEFYEMMRQMEEKMLVMLRNDFSVKNIFLTFEQDGNYSLFSYPLRMGDKVFGTISGITPGERNLSAEEEFIKAICAVLSLVLVRDKGAVSRPSEDILKIKAEAVVETAVTINHEVNNPLTAVLGNVQLLLLNADDFTPEVRERLKAVEQSALKIKEVTQNLMKIVEPSVVEYTTGLKMVDLKKSKLEDKDEDSEKDTSSGE